jgi:uncharacterized peroxidase-related enzyme
MPRLAPLPMDELGELAPMLQGMAAQSGYEMNSLMTLGRNPAIVQGLMAFVGAVMAPGNVSPELKNMVSQIVSKAAGCGYCMAHTGHAAEGSGLSADKEAALWEYETSDSFTEAERAALRVAQGAGQAPNAVTDDEFNALKEHFSEDEIIEIIAVIGMFGFFNRFNDTMATELENSPLRFAQETLGPKGWAVGKHG